MQSEPDDFPMFHTLICVHYLQEALGLITVPIMCDEISLVDLKPRICLKLQFVLFLYTPYYKK